MPKSSHIALLYMLFLVLLAAPARAQDNNLDAERFKPAITHDGFIQVEGSGVRPRADPWELGAFLNYSRNSLIVVDGAGNLTSHYISGRLGGDVFASVTIAKPFALGLDIPFFLAQTGDANPDFGGLGDIRLVPKIRIIDGFEGVGLALVAELRAPTHVSEFSGGARMIQGWPKLVLDYRSSQSLHMGINVGALIREQTTFFNVVAASEFTYSAALGYRFGGRKGVFELGGELNGAVGLVRARVEETPLEGSPYLKFYPGEVEISMGPGIGMVPGFGVPLLRAFLGIKWSPTSHDRDGDGIPDDEDKCPDQAEDYNGYEDHDGCPDGDKDDDGDGIPNYLDQCPNQKETINGFQDEDGCPDGGPAQVIREDGKFRVLQNIKFRSGSAELDPQSDSILNQVALTLKANPDIKRMRIEGHTDDTGGRDMNMRLSQERANAVRSYLIGRGIKPDRLRAEGYGPDRPLVKGNGPDALAKNRRVEFIIE